MKGSKILCPCRKCVNTFWKEAGEASSRPDQVRGATSSRPNQVQGAASSRPAAHITTSPTANDARRSEHDALVILSVF